ncbi:deoxyribose-phosphate aldolase [Toxoplasma gondii TgCatPRC2]|uniref:Deoxyribose-phosphate aldolase n=14 Tax=Toxoplasma gondii TaxID=5811 RepID=B9PHX6_TOXGV|nr:deoxyribose-phosphate aldolase [Toxoplasma gondii ME49]EPR64772.1 deoxyribose-phosphate aldolase [Toxoplasma gondii GT1]ESS36245.1 deoxyribose-phosphate aldolase [Toxoplasma gondii VEG]KFG43678.1 deoxyribose-phosphate aldolase [Toxoplasma gondii GAB2-2007-GAL-DOM2]KFG52165.1 deoxyribose-phosphate aldolase [Toxoplasma gondii p89]KFG54369.1 deoxyribose-phosphate aldolase [Toxoplasma gondii FOU]KFH05918.1 deoxyribose-phosphate aldolase [Toxoplasma gondii VAND]KYF46791.1 deoxyribose-phosphate|eukprot:XP_002365731.1 deoxyribose-phosphate aldolase [Toxoplasma gondii ME49]
MDAEQQACRAYVARRVISLIDATDLSEGSTEQSVTKLCEDALKIPRAAAVCVWPSAVKFIKKVLPSRLPEAAELTVATVLNFPSGKGSVEVVTSEALRALSDGADELDLVVDWELLNRDANAGEAALRTLVSAVRKVSGSAVLKVILETGMLSSDVPDLVVRASKAALESGADMLKTSTGKVTVNATLPAVRDMCRAIKEYQEVHKDSRIVGIKIAGGVKSLDVCAQYLNLVSDALGADFVTKRTFRIGASSLLAGAREFVL